MDEHILVVDDDREIVNAIAILREKEGYRVLRAYNGMEALDLAADPAVRRIREKIELNPKQPEYLKVVWGIGYKMEKMG